MLMGLMFSEGTNPMGPNNNIVSRVSNLQITDEIIKGPIPLPVLRLPTRTLSKLGQRKLRDQDLGPFPILVKREAIKAKLYIHSFHPG